jgi:hypothetical protein
MNRLPRLARAHPGTTIRQSLPLVSIMFAGRRAFVLEHSCIRRQSRNEKSRIGSASRNFSATRSRTIPSLQGNYAGADSDRNPLNLIQRDLVARAVVELRCPRGFVRGDPRRIFKRAAVFEICRDASRAERVAAGGGGESFGGRGFDESGECPYTESNFKSYYVP